MTHRPRKITVTGAQDPNAMIRVAISALEAMTGKALLNGDRMTCRVDTSNGHTTVTMEIDADEFGDLPDISTGRAAGIVADSQSVTGYVRVPRVKQWVGGLIVPDTMLVARTIEMLAHMRKELGIAAAETMAIRTDAQTNTVSAVVTLPIAAFDGCSTATVRQTLSRYADDMKSAMAEAIGSQSTVSRSSF